MAAFSFSRCLISILFLIGVAQGRILSLNSSGDQLISDGVDGEDSNLSTCCRHQYGFLPCGDNAAGYFFLIVVYEVLLVVGGMIIGSGSEVLFYITGERFGGILFRILRALPSMALMIYSGVFTTKETAQAQVSSVVGIYAGTTVFSLTVQWFMCVVTASKPLKEEDEDEGETSSSKSCFLIKEKLRTLIDNGVNVDLETCKTAKIMLLSLIPYVVLQLVYFFDDSSTWKRIITLISLVVSASSLIGYFAYQIMDPWMQMRSFTAEFVAEDELENLINELFKAGTKIKHDDAVERLFSNLDFDHDKKITEKEFIEGNVQWINKAKNAASASSSDINPTEMRKKCSYYEVDFCRFFGKTDNNQDKFVAEEELEKLMSELFKASKTEIKHDDAIQTVVDKLDFNHDKMITEKEFIDGIIQWIDEDKNTASSSDVSPTEMYQKAVQLLKDENNNNSSEMDKIMSKLLKHCDGQVLKSEALITDSGEPNIERIRRVFSEYDTDKSGSLSPSEVKILIGKVKFGTYQMKDEDVVKEIFRVFDEDGNKLLDEREFVKGMLEYLEKAMKVVNTPDRTNIVEEFDKIVWKEQVCVRMALVQLVVGIAMLTFLAGPLLGNILNFSDAMKAPSFLVSFVVVPLALNGQAAIAALLPASKKTKGTPSLRFSEIYGGVIMNNLSGLTGLLAIVYAKGLVWDFSAEVLTILVVCAIVGAHALCNTTYKSWKCILVFLLYPITLGLFYYFQVVCSWN